jgi:hypothetical protein
VSSDTRFEHNLRREFLENPNWVNDGTWYCQRAAGSHGLFDLDIKRGLTPSRTPQGVTWLPDVRLLQIKKTSQEPPLYTSASSGELREEIQAVKTFIRTRPWMHPNAEFGPQAHYVVRWTNPPNAGLSKEERWEVLNAHELNPEEPIRYGQGRPLKVLK